MIMQQVAASGVPVAIAEDLEICGLGGKPAIASPGCGCWYCRGCPGWPDFVVDGAARNAANYE